MARETPTLSIVIPMKNEAANVEALLGEIAAVGADLPPYEVIVVDDGSTDDTAGTVIRLAAADPHLRLIRRVIEAHGFALGHVPLIGHPPHDLTPEAIVILVFDALAPAPRSIGAHEEHLAGAERARDD